MSIKEKIQNVIVHNWKLILISVILLIGIVLVTRVYFNNSNPKLIENEDAAIKIAQRIVEDRNPGLAKNLKKVGEYIEYNASYNEGIWVVHSRIKVFDNSGSVNGGVTIRLSNTGQLMSYEVAD